MSINRVTLFGRLGADPEIRRLNNGKLVANLRLACEERWKDKSSGNWEKRTEWVPVVIWVEHLVELVEQYVKKGDALYVEGKFQTRKWQDQNGADKYATEVVLQGFDGKIELCGGGRRGGSRDDGDRDERRGGGGDERGSGGRSFGGGSGSGSRGPRSMTDDLDDEIPFAPEFR